MFRPMRPLFILLLLVGLATAAPLERFYLGTYTAKSASQGIYQGGLDADTGKLEPLELAATAANPSFLALTPDGQFLYANSSDPSGQASAYRVGSAGRLQFLNSQPSGKGGCHVVVDASGRNVFVANYSDGTLACFRTATNGWLDPEIARIPFAGSGPNQERQAHPFLHASYLDAANRHLYACDLGTDHIWIFDLDAASGRLSPAHPPSAMVPPGSGPRHLAFSPDQAFAYVNGEMGLNVTAFARDAVTGSLRALQTVAALPAEADTNGFTTGEIFCHPSGRWLYVSNRDVSGRGRDSLAVYRIGGDGRLTWIQNAPAQVSVPRSFALDPAGRWIIACGQKDNRIAVLKIAEATGTLSFVGQTALVGAPTCVLFVPEANKGKAEVGKRKAETKE